MRKFEDYCYNAWLMISVLFVILSTPVSAQILVGENFPITTAAEFENGPAVAANPANGEFLTVWGNSLKISDNPLAFQVEILGQRISSSGVLIGESILVTFAAGDNPALGGFNPDIAFNSQTNEFFVVYEREYFGSTNNGIFGQLIAANGSLIGGEIPIFAGVSQTDAAIAHNSISNEYLVVWGQSAGGVRGRIINAEGMPITAAFELSTGLTGAGNAAVVFNAATNQYFVVWHAFASPFFPGIAEIFGRLVNADGTFAGPFFAITTANESQAFPSVALNPVANQYLVIWGDNRNIGLTYGDIFGQLVNTNGSLVGGNIPISAFPFNEGASSVAYVPATNQYLSVWAGQPSGGPPIVDVFGRLLEPDVSPLGDSFQVSSAGKVEFFFTDLAVNPGTNVVLSVWPDDRNVAVSNTDIFGQLIAISNPVIRVDIDIKPGGDPNSINPNSQGVIPVAILTSDTFDASTVDSTTVRFGKTETEAVLVQSAVEDIDGDGDTDMILHFNTQASGIQCGETSASLSGQTVSGQAIQGSDSVITVGCK